MFTLEEANYYVRNQLAQTVTLERLHGAVDSKSASTVSHAIVPSWKSSPVIPSDDCIPSQQQPQPSGRPQMRAAQPNPFQFLNYKIGAK